jgi:hypothetical protein
MADKAKVIGFGRQFAAKFSGKCAVCGIVIRKGSPIVMATLQGRTGKAAIHWDCTGEHEFAKAHLEAYRRPQRAMDYYDANPITGTGNLGWDPLEEKGEPGPEPPVAGHLYRCSTCNQDQVLAMAPSEFRRATGSFVRCPNDGATLTYKGRECHQGCSPKYGPADGEGFHMDGCPQTYGRGRWDS